MSDWWEMLIGSRREMDPHAHKQRERENKHGTRQETQERDDSRNTEGGAPVNRERLKLRMDLNLCLCCQDLKTLICSNCDCYLSDFLSTQLKFKLSSCAPSFSSCVFNEFFPFSFLVEWTSFPQSKLFLLSCVISPHWVIFLLNCCTKTVIIIIMILTLLVPSAAAALRWLCCTSFSSVLWFIQNTPVLQWGCQMS